MSFLVTYKDEIFWVFIVLGMLTQLFVLQVMDDDPSRSLMSKTFFSLKFSFPFFIAAMLMGIFYP
ncbi:hypothetical protein [Acinetobacter baumannii]|uniref:hypothetical protein n=1 Tax=Acinetobacter baumannii TaxID=470 RepID=UPI000DF1FBF4|nr:hypothetical protein [Acinetobacter baumannii]RCT89685.1 hypothetical protein DVA68_15920 [Acinetobacter baumannii]